MLRVDKLRRSQPGLDRLTMASRSLWLLGRKNQRFSFFCMYFLYNNPHIYIYINIYIFIYIYIHEQG